MFIEYVIEDGVFLAGSGEKEIDSRLMGEKLKQCSSGVVVGWKLSWFC